MINQKGTVLPVVVVGMMIMIIIGMVCLQMFTAQNLLDTFDESKVRTRYAAEGMIEAYRGYIEAETAANLRPDGDSWNSTDGYLYMNVVASTAGKWSPFDMGEFYDAALYPPVKVSAYIEEMTSFASEDNGTEMHSGVRPSGVPINNHPVSVFYRIVSVASTTVNLQLIVSTVTYYFYTERAGDGVGTPYSHTKHFRAWRKN